MQNSLLSQIPGNDEDRACVNLLFTEDFGPDVPTGWEGDFMLLDPPLVEGWILEDGSTDTDDTGPDDPFSGTHYLYLETNGPAQVNSIYRVNTPAIQLTDVYTNLRFRVLMYGAQTGSLRVNVLSGPGFGTSENVLSINGEQHGSGAFENWTEAFVDIRQYDGQLIKIEFEGMKMDGELGDIAIDLVEVCTEPVVPTLGEWSLIILALSLLIIGLVYMENQEQLKTRINTL